MPQIKFYQGEENGVIIEKNDYANSLFKHQYRQAIKTLSNTYETIEAVPDEDEMNVDLSNIVAFCGDRGEGKSSCMKSVVEIITNENDSEETRDLYNGCEQFKDVKWVKLDSIDPAMFDTKHNVLEITIGLLYSVFRAHESAQTTESKRNRVNDCFRKVKSDLHHLMDETSQMFDQLDEIDRLSASIQLRSHISQLFKTYLEYVNKSKILIIIDDIDLNMTRAYTMAEQIRTFLNNKHCLILMSSRIEQLQEVIATSLKKEMGAQVISSEIRAMAVKYVTKFIPFGNRINMPKVYDVASNSIAFYNNRKDEKPVVFDSVTMAVVELIFKKTRYLFYNSQGKVSPIIPNNLRSLRQLLALLLRMPDFPGNNVSTENKRNFKHYFYYTWTKGLSAEHQEFINKICSSQDIISLNKTVLMYLKNSKIIGELNIEDRLLMDILNAYNYVYNVSLGDVIYVLQYLEQNVTDEDSQKLIFFLTSWYSIMLYENYDELTEGKDVLNSTEKRNDIYKIDATFGKIYKIQKLVNGAYFTYRSQDILPPSNNPEMMDRDLKVINGSVLQEIAKNLGENIRKYNNHEMSDDEEKSFKYDFRMLEFFSLTIRRSIESRNQATPDHLNRKKLEPQHIDSFNGQKKLFVFDVLSPFTYIHNVRLAYNRFTVVESDVMYEFAKKEDWSVLRQMIDKVLRKEAEESHSQYVPCEKLEWSHAKHRLLSNATIRNTEVLTAVLNQIKSKRYSYRSAKSNANMLSQLYRNLIKSDMRTYDKSDGKPYEMRFAFLEAFVDFLGESDNQRFYDIYNHQKFESVRTPKRNRKSEALF